MSRRPSALYADPALYDRLHRADTAAEAAELEALFARYGNGGSDWLEPACGTGRLIAHFAEKGRRVRGYDAEPRMVAFARRRGMDVRAGRMESFRPPGKYDLAYSILGTFRHLPSEAAALQHLRLVAAALNPGGLYIVGLDLADYDAAVDDEEVWETEGLSHVMMTFAPDRRRRRERVLHFVRDGKRLLEDEYELRSYDAIEWSRLAAASRLTLIEPRPAPGYRLFVLRRA